MIDFVDFVSAVQLERMKGDPSWAVISVSDTDKPDVSVPPAFGASLRLNFDDLDPAALAQGSIGRVFTARMAMALLVFLDRLHAHPGISGVIVQCEAGRSRSAAIAVFIAGAYRARFVEERRVDGRNEFVLRALEHASGTVVPRPSGTVVLP